MDRLLRALAALLVLLLAAASVAVADDGWFPADLLCFGSVPAQVCRAAGGSRAAREREGEQALARVVLRAVLLCWYFISAAAGMPLPAA